MKRSTLFVLLIVVVLSGIVIYQTFVCGEAAIRLALADEQTQIFTEMVTKASLALKNSPPDTARAIECLQYAHHYYPSGTKQVEGSQLDRIVERSRQLAEMRIIEMLRKATGMDRGNEADAWIKAQR